MTTLNSIDNNGIQMTLDNTNKSISIDPDNGLIIKYDLLTGNPKTFTISNTGMNFLDNTQNNTTFLSRIALLQQALAAVEVPPNTHTLEIIDSVLVRDTGVNSIALDALVPSIIISNNVNTTVIENNLITLKTVPVCPEYIQYYTTDTGTFPTYDRNPHKITLINQGVNPLLGFKTIQDYTSNPAYIFPTGEVVNCMVNYGFVYFGCQSGNLYHFDNTNMILDTTFDEAIYTMDVNTFDNSIWIGGAFLNIVNSYNCNYIAGFNPNYGGVFPLQWNNGGGCVGFNNIVRTICFDPQANTRCYVGGDFDNIANQSFPLKYFACIDVSTGYNTPQIYAIEDNNTGQPGGFDAAVNSISMGSSYNMIVCGTDFSTLSYSAEVAGQPETYYSIVFIQWNSLYIINSATFVGSSNSSFVNQGSGLKSIFETRSASQFAIAGNYTVDGFSNLSSCSSNGGSLSFFDNPSLTVNAISFFSGKVYYNQGYEIILAGFGSIGHNNDYSSKATSIVLNSQTNTPVFSYDNSTTTPCYTWSLINNVVISSPHPVQQQGANSLTYYNIILQGKTASITMVYDGNIYWVLTQYNAAYY